MTGFFGDMTAAGMWRHKPAGQAKGSVVGEAWAAVLSGIRHVWRLTGLTVLQRFLVACLKVVAILGYHYGKASAAATPARNGHGQRRQEQAAATAMSGCDPFCQQVCTACRSRRRLQESGRI